MTLTYDVLDRLTSYGSAFTAEYRADGLRARKQTGAEADGRGSRRARAAMHGAEFVVEATDERRITKVRLIRCPDLFPAEDSGPGDTARTGFLVDSDNEARPKRTALRR